MIQRLSIGTAFDEIALRHPEKEALISRDVRLTYKQLRENADLFARGLICLGGKKNEKFSVWMNNNVEWVYAFLGSAKTGMVFVSVNARFKESELDYILKQSDTTTVLFKDRLHKTNYLEMFKKLCPEIVSSRPGDLQSAKFPLLRNVICVPSSDISGIFSFPKVLQLGETGVSVSALEKRQNAVHPEDLAMIQYTSGTTSFPKGCMLDHAQIVRDVLAMGKNMDMVPEDRIYCPLPFSHVGGSLITLLKGLLRGATIVTSEHFDPEQALKIISEEKCTVMNAVETIWLELLKHPRLEQYDIRSLKKGWTTGPPELRRAISEKMGVHRFVSTYGLSEGTANTGTTLADDPLELKLAWNGKPHPGTEMKIVDPKTNQTLSPGQEGEICLRGYTVMKGYYKMAEETAAAIDKDGWLHTGDLGCMNEKGYFAFRGRLKEMLRVGGENVAPLEVEGFFLQHPAVQQAQVIGVPDKKLVEVPALIVKLKEGQSASEDDILAFAKGKLSSFKIPRHVWIVEEFPLTASGKIQKYKLKEKATQRFKRV